MYPIFIICQEVLLDICLNYRDKKRPGLIRPGREIRPVWRQSVPAFLFSHASCVGPAGRYGNFYLFDTYKAISPCLNYPAPSPPPQPQNNSHNEDYE